MSNQNTQPAKNKNYRDFVKKEKDFYFNLL